VIDVLVPAVEKALKNPEVIQRGVNAGMEVEYVGPKELRKRLESEIKIVKAVSAEAGMIK